MNRRDPRFQRTLDDLSGTLETLTTQTQNAAFSFTQTYLNPCLASVSTCLDASCAPCIAARRDRTRARRQRHQSRASSRPELSFDFYNDAWEDEEGADESTGLLSGWGADELDRILAGRGGAEQPGGERRVMNYGANAGPRGRGRTRGLSVGKGEQDPRVLPGSSMFGFLERLPWRIGGRGVRYRPSAADLQEGLGRKDRSEGDLLLDDSEDAESWGEGPAAGGRRGAQHRRQRSATVKSTSTTNSLSSRGDLFPSDEEDDAVPLDDEFAMALERRNTGEDAPSSARSVKSKLARSMSGFTTGSKSTKSSRRKKRASGGESEPPTPGSDMRTPTSEVRMTLAEEGKDIPEAAENDGLPSMDELRAEDEQVRVEEEAEVERKREEAQKVAAERGLISDEHSDKAPAAEGDDKSTGNDTGGPQQPPNTTNETEGMEATLTPPASSLHGKDGSRTPEG
ncbi:MAG: hypothetical protein MMC23_003617 [Stictis urceolatum]|nr:hypothetical protein [Stictis urceolata]